MDGLARVTGLGFIKRLLGSHDEPHHPRTSLGARMLVIDDSPTICAVLGKMLRLDGYRAVSATDGAEAIEMARREQPTLIFLDVIMPGMNGFRVLKKLRQDPLTADIPIVMISGNQQASEQFYLQRCGADDFMKKPFDRNDVAQRIGQLVTAGKIARRDTSGAAVEATPPMAAATMDHIPDIAMPDPEETLSMDLPTPRARKISGMV
ncbi:MAG: response regulator [Rhodanobacter sp.]